MAMRRVELKIYELHTYLYACVLNNIPPPPHTYRVYIKNTKECLLTVGEDDLPSPCAVGRTRYMYTTYICMCVCVQTHTHTHTHMRTETYIYIFTVGKDGLPWPCAVGRTKNICTRV